MYGPNDLLVGCLSCSGSLVGGCLRSGRAMSQLVVSRPMKGSAHWVTAFDNSQVAELQARKVEKVLGASALPKERKHFVKCCPFPPTSLLSSPARY